MTAEDVATQVRETMQQQQAQMLEIMERRSRELLDERDRRAEVAVRDHVEDQLQVRQPQMTWRNEINRSNYNALAEIQMMWERTERFVDAMEPREGQQDLKGAAKTVIEKGKTLVRDRLKVLRFADRDGWTAAMNFLGDDIADDEAEAKKMKRGRKEAEKARAVRESKGKNSASGYRYENMRERGAGRSTREGERDRKRTYERSRSERHYECFICGRAGHFARACPRR